MQVEAYRADRRAGGASMSAAINRLFRPCDV